MFNIIEKRRVAPTFEYHAGSKSSKLQAKNGKFGILFCMLSIFMLTIIKSKHELRNCTINIFHMLADISELRVLFFSNDVKSLRMMTTTAFIIGTATTIAIEIAVYFRYESMKFLHGLIVVPGKVYELTLIVSVDNFE